MTISPSVITVTAFKGAPLQLDTLSPSNAPLLHAGIKLQFYNQQQVKCQFFILLHQGYSCHTTEKPHNPSILSYDYMRFQILNPLFSSKKVKGKVHPGTGH